MNKKKYNGFYTARQFRISDKIFEKLKKIKKRDETWNLTFKKIIEKYGK